MKKVKNIIKWGLIALGTLFLLSVAGVMLLLAFYGNHEGKNRGTIVYISGEYMTQEINKYRRDKGLPELSPVLELCDEISSRAIQRVNNPSGDGHEGFEEWKNKVAPEWNVMELIFTSNGSLQPEAVLYGWEISPPHKLMLEDQKATNMCVYVLNATADEKGNIISPQVVVAELGWK